MNSLAIYNMQNANGIWIVIVVGIWIVIVVGIWFAAQDPFDTLFANAAHEHERGHFREQLEMIQQVSLCLRLPPSMLPPSMHL